LGGYLKFAIEGKYCPYGNFEESDDGMADGFVSVADAARIVEELTKLPFFKQILGMVKDQYRQNDLDFPPGGGEIPAASLRHAEEGLCGRRKKENGRTYRDRLSGVPEVVRRATYFLSVIFPNQPYVISNLSNRPAFKPSAGR
jgi:hypothetical protein